MVLDMNKAKASLGKEDLLPHTFAVLEQSPDNIVYEDLSKYLKVFIPIKLGKSIFFCI